MTRFRLGLALAAYAWLGAFVIATQGATVRFEAESTGAVKDQGDIAAYDSINGVWARDLDASASGGTILRSTNTVSRDIKIGFVGTGVDLIARKAPDGAGFSWILDGGALSGTGTTNGALLDQASVPIISGLANTLHTLEIRHDGTAGTILRPDAFDVHDAGSQTRFEMEGNLPIVYTPDANWTRPYPFNDAAEEASGGNIGYSVTTGDKATLNFTGTAVSIITSSRPDASVLEWNIDGGAVTGSVNPALANRLGFGFNHRWPFLLTNSLAPGNHTLVITSKITIGAANFDAIDVFGVPEPASFLLAAGSAVGLVAAVRRRAGARHG